VPHSRRETDESAKRSVNRSVKTNIADDEVVPRDGSKIPSRVEMFELAVRRNQSAKERTI